MNNFPAQKSVLDDDPAIVRDGHDTLTHPTPQQGIDGIAHVVGVEVEHVYNTTGQQVGIEEDIFTDLLPQEMPTPEIPESATEASRSVSSIKGLIETYQSGDDPQQILDEITTFVAKHSEDYSSSNDLWVLVREHFPRIKDDVKAKLDQGTMDVWTRSAFRECCSGVLNSLHISDPFNEKGPEPPELLEERQSIRELYDALTDSVQEEVSDNGSRVVDLMQTYPQTSRSTSYKELSDYDKIYGEKRYSWSEESPVEKKQEPTPEEVVDVSKRFNSVKHITKLIVTNNTENRAELFSNIELLDRFIPPDDDKEEQKKAVTRLGEITGATGYKAELTIEEFGAISEALEGAGLTTDKILSFISDSRRLKLLDEMYHDENPEIFEIVTLLAQTDLFYQDNEEIYQFNQKDLRDIALQEIQIQPEEYGDYIRALNPLMDKVKEAGFPVEHLTELLLGRLNPQDTTNYNRDPAQPFAAEFRALEIAEKIGDKLTGIFSVDKETGRRILYDLIHVSGKYEDVESQIGTLITISSEITELEENDPELATWACEMARTTGFGGVHGLQANIKTAKYLQTFPELRARVFRKENVAIDDSYIRIQDYIERVYFESPPELSGFAGLEGIETFFNKVESLRTEIENGTLELKQILGFAIRHDEQQLATLKEIVGSDFLKQLRADENYISFIESSIVSDDLVLSAMVELGSLEEAEKLYNSWEKFGNKNWNPYPILLDDIVEFRKSFPEGRTEVRERNEEVLFSLLERATTMTDKDGFPYESITSVIEMYKSTLLRMDSTELASILLWFNTGNTPYATLPSILSARENAIADGVENNPDAIFEWVHRPENRELVSKKALFDYLTQRLAMTPEEIEEVAAEAYDSQDDLRVIINADHDIISKIIEEGGDIKSLFDREVFFGSGKKLHIGNQGYLYRRSGVEIAMGLRSMDHSDEHPVYGTCIFLGNEGTKKGAQGYGKAVIVLDTSKIDEENVTFTPEDSFRAATLLTREDAMVLRRAKDKKGLGGTKTSDYVEAQIRGGVDFSMAQEIVVFSADEAEDLRKRIPPELHSLVVVR